MMNTGLSSEKVAELTARGLYNKPVENQSKTVKQIIVSNVFTYFNLIFAIFSVLLIVVHSYRDLSFMPVIIANTLIGIVQEIRSKKVLDKLSVLNAPKARVIRDSKESIVDAVSLVVGDLVIFGAGNQICADAIVDDGEVQVNESLITGEADEVTKRAGDRLLSGSFIVSGKCKAVLEKVGHDSYVSKLTIEAKKTKHGRQSEMIRSLDKLVKTIGILLIPIGLGLFAMQHWKLGLSIKASTVSSIAALVGMIPEGLYLLASVALVVSVMRLASRKVLVHEMACIETLARVNVLCVDKTGTITENIMEVNEIFPLKNYEKAKAEYPPLHQMIGEFAHSMSNDNVTMDALQRYFVGKLEHRADSTTPFSSANKYCSATFGNKVYVLGAAEFVLREDYDIYKEMIESYSAKGQRVLVYGVYDGIADGKALTGKVNPLALLSISNPIRKEAKATFEYFESQGVEIKVISGDNPVTVSHVAEKAGISNADKYVDASTLITEEDIKQAVDQYTIFGRVTPKQKRQFVKALKENGRTVAMTGDGVNDVLALKDADCSIAMASGSDAAANAAQLVLLDSNFSCMPSVVFEGRRVVNNLQRSASLFLIKNIFSMLLAIFTLIFSLKYPLVPSQISLLGVFTIGAPAFFLALQPNKSIIKGHFLTNVLIKALPAGLTDFITVAVLAVSGEYIGIPSEQLSTIAIIILLTIGMVTLTRVCYPFDRLRLAICITMFAGIICSFVFLNDLFALYMLTFNQMIFLAGFLVIAIPLLFLLSYAVDRSTDFLAKHSKRFRKRLGR